MIAQHTSASPAKTGLLWPIGERRLGGASHPYWRCVDCETDYAGAQRNGKPIGLCPWCRPDSKPWTKRERSMSAQLRGFNEECPDDAAIAKVTGSQS